MGCSSEQPFFMNFLSSDFLPGQTVAMFDTRAILLWQLEVFPVYGISL